MLDLNRDAPPRACARCATELPALALACPACSALVHRDRLEQLAERATAADAAGDRATARALWQEARALVPVQSEQHQIIGARLTALVDDESPRPAAAQNGNKTWWTRGLGAAAAIGLLFASKLKFLLLGLSKLSTFVSMFGFIAVYWSIHGWPLAVGLAGSIYVHEMGHVAMLRRLGIQAGAPLFIPGVGALVMLKEHVTDPVIDARIGLAGPVWGLGAAVAAWVAYLVTGAAIWLAIAELTGFLNLFNLIPVWQLDGARGFHALSRQERWMVLGVIGLALWATGVHVLWIVGAVAMYRTIRGEAGPGHRPTLVTFAGLVLALAWFARSVT
ncbi:MAG TPA: site-2 protease family protein [Vicinamibacterales bacterium]